MGDGGTLVDTVGWRWIFLVNLPAVAAILLIGRRWVPETRSPVREPLDLAGLALLGLVLTGLEIDRRNQLLAGADPRFSHLRREGLDGIMAGSNYANEFLQRLTPAARHAAREAAATSFVSGFRGAMLVTALMAAAAGITSGILIGRRRRTLAPAVQSATTDGPSAQAGA
jgi:hypothetical protein